MLQKLKRLLATVLMAGILVTAVSPMVPTAWAAYTDDAGGWYSPMIQKARDYQLMNGYPDGSFGVGLDITRGEFVTVLCQMFRWEPLEEPENNGLTDVGKYWGRKNIYAAVAHGVAEPEGEFRPKEPISREEMAIMLVKALGYGDLAEKRSETELPFADVTENKGYIRVAYDIGMTAGVPGPDGTLNFLPHDSARREEAAAMLVNVYERYISKTDWLHGFYAFSSFSQIDLGTQMDEVSMGWARLSWNEEEGVYLNTSRSGGNEWALPEEPRASLDLLEEAEVPHNLNIYADTSKQVKLSEEESISVLELLLTDEEHAEKTVALLVEAAQDHAGLTIDFEGLKDEAWREPFAALLSRLREALPQDKTLYVCVPPDIWYHSYDYRALGEICDKVILMAHDYQFPSIPKGYVGTGKTYSPVTPLSDIYTALQHLTDKETGVQDKSKAALQISFGTAGFLVDEDELIQNTTIYHPSSATIATRLEQEDTLYVWDEVSRNPYIIYTTEAGNRYKLWYENAPAVAEKLTLAHMFGVTGVSVWRLGTIPNFPEIENYDVWQVFTDR